MLKPRPAIPPKDRAVPLRRRVAPFGDPERFRGCERSAGYWEVPLGKIAPDPGQPRRSFDPDDLAELAENLKSQGLISPIEVRWDGEARVYRIVAGERRWRAARLAGFARITCQVSDDPLAPEDLRARQLAENCARRDLAPLELAAALADLAGPCGWSTRRIADETGLSTTSVAEALALLALPPDVRDLVESGDLAPSTAYEVSKLPDIDDQVDLACRAAGEGLSRDRVRAEVRARKESGGEGRGPGGEGRGPGGEGRGGAAILAPADPRECSAAEHSDAPLADASARPAATQPAGAEPNRFRDRMGPPPPGKELPPILSYDAGDAPGDVTVSISCRIGVPMDAVGALTRALELARRDVAALGLPDLAPGARVRIRCRGNAHDGRPGAVDDHRSPNPLLIWVVLDEQPDLPRQTLSFHRDKVVPEAGKGG